MTENKSVPRVQGRLAQRIYRVDGRVENVYEETITYHCSDAVKMEIYRVLTKQAEDREIDAVARPLVESAHLGGPDVTP